MKPEDSLKLISECLNEGAIQELGVSLRLDARSFTLDEMFELARWGGNCKDFSKSPPLTEWLAMLVMSEMNRRAVEDSDDPIENAPAVINPTRWSGLDLGNALFFCMASNWIFEGVAIARLNKKLTSILLQETRYRLEQADKNKGV